ncbi:hypothetical protein B296_00018254 [Ensete ventricosum]|uniref:Uncharacterized protein n=1 Tax=Ensete ventricosum TaxID=4639 RepID=A0A426YWP3_ENSVE|nr:hypothetical protein B296_00018254 [Ensete ventricosum]
MGEPREVIDLLLPAAKERWVLVEAIGEDENERLRDGYEGAARRDAMRCDAMRCFISRLKSPKADVARDSLSTLRLPDA